MKTLILYVVCLQESLRERAVPGACSVVEWKKKIMVYCCIKTCGCKFHLRAGQKVGDLGTEVLS
jgi:hypothetical protein